MPPAAGGAGGPSWTPRRGKDPLFTHIATGMMMHVLKRDLFGLARRPVAQDTDGTKPAFPLSGSPEGEALWSPKASLLPTLPTLPILPLFLAGLVACFLLAVPRPARAVDAGELAGRIQKKYAAISAFSANFKQAIRNAASGDTEHRSGQFLFKSPCSCAGDGQAEKELLIVGKDAVWDYFEEDKEAYRYSVPRSSAPRPCCGS